MIQERKNKEEQNEDFQNPIQQAFMELQQQIRHLNTSKKYSGKTESLNNNLATSFIKNIRDNNYDSQGIVNVKDVRNGLIYTDDGKIVKILQILPVNYYQKKTYEKNNIAASFSDIFKAAGPKTLHFKMRTERFDVVELIDIIKSNTFKTNNKKLKYRAKDYIRHIKSLQTDETYERVYYLTFQYEGENGKFSNSISDIERVMKNKERYIRSILNSCGNIVIEPERDDEEEFILEILYKFYNPISSEYEPFRQRKERLLNDYFNTYGDKVKPDKTSYIAPRGLISRATKDWFLMDGMYHSYLIFRDNSYPENTETAWLDAIIPVSLGTDIDIISQKENRSFVLNTLKQTNKYKIASLNANANKRDKAERLSKEIRNAQYVKKVLEQYDEDLFSVIIIITIRTLTFREMQDRKNYIKDKLSSFSVYTATSTLTAHEFLKMTAPLTYINRGVFNKYKHNLLTRNMCQLYPYTVYALREKQGFVLGKNKKGKTFLSFNNFNTQRYSNANIVILGTSGSGKSFFEMMLGYRLRMMNIRTMYVLPLKGYEYEKACIEMGGEYISLVSGSKACINIMEIRPQVDIDGNLIEESGGGFDNILLGQKITSLTTWLQLNMGKEVLSVSEKNIFNKLCMQLYENYGITTDNDSIWLDKKNRILKRMPILQDLNDALENEPRLSHIKDVLSPYMANGQFSNFNGLTNVDLTNPFIVFDVNERGIGKDFLPAIMYIAYSCCYDLARQSLTSKDVIFLDEVWRMLSNEECADQLKEMVKIVRGYGAATVLATQDISDFLNACNGTGPSILASSEIKFILKLKEIELNALSKILNLTDNDIKEINAFPAHGNTMMISNQDKIIIDLIASESEKIIFDTDVNNKSKTR